MAWLRRGEKNSKISLFVLAQLTNVTDRRTDRQRDAHRMPAIAALCIASHGKNGNKTVNLNVKNFHRSLTTVERAQNDTSKTANITDTIFSRNKRSK